MENKLQSLNKSVESELATEKRDIDCKQLENELWTNLAAYMNSELLYTIKRLLPADLKVIYDYLFYLFQKKIPVSRTFQEYFSTLKMYYSVILVI